MIRTGKVDLVAASRLTRKCSRQAGQSHAPRGRHRPRADKERRFARAVS